MERLSLNATSRPETGKGVARKLRAQGLIPGVIYGLQQEPQALSLNPKELDTVLLKAGGTNVLLDLQIDGKQKLPVMVSEYQVHVINRKFLHVDFIKVDLSKKIHVEVPVHLVGKAPGVKEGGILEHMRRTLEVICLPTAIPEFIEVDISSLQIGDKIHAHDLKLMAGVEVVAATDLTIAAVVTPQEEKVVATEATSAEPEVIGKKKEDAAPADDKDKKKK